jgi:hypothetical protein
MSFRRPKVSNRRSSATHPTSSPSLPSTPHIRVPSAVLIDVDQCPRQRRPRNTRQLFLPGPEPLLALPGGIRLTQVHGPTDPIITSPRRRISTQDRREHDSVFDDVFTSAFLDSDINGRRRKEKQWERWTTDVIPSLLRPYLRLLRETNSLRDMPTNNADGCTCGSPGRQLSVLAVSFDREF